MNKPVSDYKDLEVWQVAMDLVVAAYELASQLPPSERYELSSQLRRAAVSVPSNIAEGYGRYYRAEYLKGLTHANGSLKELETQAILTVRLRLVPEGANADVLRLSNQVGRMLTGLRRSLS